MHILAINNEISWSEYKWVDLNGYGMHMPAGGYDEHTGFSYEPRAHHNRLLDTRVPEPGKEIAIISEKWGVIGSNIKCKISLRSSLLKCSSGGGVGVFAVPTNDLFCPRRSLDKSQR